jgi:hypothetical protein
LPTTKILLENALAYFSLNVRINTYLICWMKP